MPRQSREGLLVRLDREVAEELLHPKGLMHNQTRSPHGALDHALRAALSQQSDERTEYRVMAGGEPQAANDRRHAEDLGRSYRFVGAANVGIQQRTITSYQDGSQWIGPWRDLEEGEHGR